MASHEPPPAPSLHCLYNVGARSSGGAGVQRVPIWAELGHANPSELQCVCDVALNQNQQPVQTLKEVAHSLRMPETCVCADV